MVILTALLCKLKSYTKNPENHQILLYCLIIVDFMKSFENKQHFSQLQFLTHQDLKSKYF